ncbi:MAG: pseudouridine synthase [Patescibacteria group bacterium]|nr:pseudouridine synthase [Patescibacteria group bacterium]
MLERLQKILARQGIASRRGAEELILAGKIKVNGRIAKIGEKYDEEEDEIEVDGKKLMKNEKRKMKNNGNSNFVYYLLNKPRGYECSLVARHGDKLAVDLVPKFPRVWTVGRLDKNSRGLLILTNDGKLTEELTHPKFEHEKEYEVLVNKPLTNDFFRRMQKGVALSEGLARADKIRQLGDKKFSLTLHQGWKRQIRRMCESLGYRTIDLVRVRVGKWRLGNLREGKFRKINGCHPEERERRRIS